MGLAACMMFECATRASDGSVFCSSCLAHVSSELRAILDAGHDRWVRVDLFGLKPWIHATHLAKDLICRAKLAEAHERQDFEAALLYGTLLDRIAYHVKHTAPDPVYP